MISEDIYESEFNKQPAEDFSPAGSGNSDEGTERIGGCLCRKLTDGGFLLLKYTGEEENAVVPAKVTAVAEGAFEGCSVLSVLLEGPGVTIWFPKSHSYYLKKMLEGFGKNGKLFDFEAYDRFLMTDHFNSERIKMLKGRLVSGYEISGDTALALLENMREHEEEMIEAVTGKGTGEMLEDLADTGFFTEENIDSFLDGVNRTERKDLVGWLMDYKHAHFSNTEFDFSI